MLTHDGTRVITTMTGRTEIRDARDAARAPAVAVPAPMRRRSAPTITRCCWATATARCASSTSAPAMSRTASGRHAGPVMRATFGPDGRTAVTAGEDNRVIVWDARRGAITETLEGHAGQTTSLAISRDGRTLYTGALDGNVLIWDLIGERRLDRRFRIGPLRPSSFSESLPSADRGGRAPRAFMSTALSRDGRILAAGHDDGTVSLFDVSTLRPISTFRAVPRGPVRGMGYIPHTRLLVVGGDGGFLGIFDPDTGRLMQRLPGDRPRGAGLPQLTGLGTQIPPSFSADGRLMATADFGNNVLRWRMRAGRAGRDPAQLPPLARHPRRVAQPGRQDDGSGGGTGRRGRRRRDAAATGRPARREQRALCPVHARRSVRGRGQQQRLGAYVVDEDVAAGRPGARRPHGRGAVGVGEPGRPHRRHGQRRRHDPTVRRGHAEASRRAPATVPNRPVAPLFTPDGDYLLAITSARQAHRWDARPSAWAQRACAVAGRTLTRAEWNDALPGRDVRARVHDLTSA